MTSLSPFRSDLVKGRVALITGGGTGIGFEISSQLGKHGAKVVIMGRRKNFLEEAIKILSSQGVDAAYFAGDVRNLEDCEAAANFAVSKYGKLDTLICSAAGNFLAVSEELTPNGFKTVMEIDALGVFNSSRAAFPHLKNAKNGLIVNISATLHYGATWWQMAPSAAKAAIDSMTRSFALEWGEYGIRVNGIAPGPIADTPGTVKLSGNIPQTVIDEQMKKGVPLGRLGTKLEIAQTVLFLCFNEYVTGDILVVDGGEWLMSTRAIPRSTVSSLSRKVEGVSRALGPGGSASKL